MAWAEKDASFHDQYARARDIGLDVLAEDCIAIADDSSGDYEIRVNEKGHKYTALNPDNAQRSRLRFDARRWYLSKLAPKKYGDRVENRLTDPDGNALKIVVTGIRPTDQNT
jgi:hypothetical protein